jgi:shikimate kinase
MSGVGKSTLLRALASRGYLTVDTDDDGWTLADGRWDADRMASLLAGHPTVCVSGTVDNQGRFYDRFEHVVLLTAPIDVILDRVRSRTNSAYGKTPEQEAEILRYVRDVEPLLRAGSSVVMDGTRPIDDLADEMAALLAGR